MITSEEDNDTDVTDANVNDEVPVFVGNHLRKDKTYHQLLGGISRLFSDRFGFELPREHYHDLTLRYIEEYRRVRSLPKLRKVLWLDSAQAQIGRRDPSGSNSLRLEPENTDPSDGGGYKFNFSFLYLRYMKSVPKRKRGSNSVVAGPIGQSSKDECKIRRFRTEKRVFLQVSVEDSGGGRPYFAETFMYKITKEKKLTDSFLSDVTDVMFEFIRDRERKTGMIDDDVKKGGPDSFTRDLKTELIFGDRNGPDWARGGTDISRSIDKTFREKVFYETPSIFGSSIKGE